MKACLKLMINPSFLYSSGRLFYFSVIISNGLDGGHTIICEQLRGNFPFINMVFHTLTNCR